MQISSKLMDKIGISASILCALHCFAAPALMGIAPLFGFAYLFDESFENILILSTFSLALFTFGWCYATKHRNLSPLLIFLIALILIILSRLELEQLSWPESILTACAGLCLASSHYLNVKLCKSFCQDCNSHKH